MYLHENKEAFNDYIQKTTEFFETDPAYVEKDYYIVLVLRKLVEKLPTFLFKGGTSLSKCHHVINRFSEDLDISLAQEKISERPRKRVKEAIKATCNELGLNITNLEKTQSDRDYNRYEIDYFPTYLSSALKPYLYIESVYMVKNYPWEECTISSMIGDYLTQTGRNDLLEKYELEPFSITVQTLSRTLADKIFALCDYYIENKPERLNRTSRHIYDIYNILNVVPLDEDFKNLFNQVREDRRISRSRTPSAEEDVDIPGILQSIIDNEIFKQDYIDVTYKMLNDHLDYDTAITGIQKIIDSGLLTK